MRIINSIVGILLGSLSYFIVEKNIYCYSGQFIWVISDIKQFSRLCCDTISCFFRDCFSIHNIIIYKS